MRASSTDASARRRRRVHDVQARAPDRDAPGQPEDRRVTLLLIVLAFSFAWSIGSHYTGACMGMPYALGAVSARTALLLMAPLALVGATFLSGKVAQTVGERLLTAEPTKLGEVVVVAVAFGVTALYNRARIPTSTIQLLVGSVAGVAVGDSAGVHWRAIGAVGAHWLVARPAAAALGLLGGRAFRNIRNVGTPLVAVGCAASVVMGAND